MTKLLLVELAAGALGLTACRARDPGGCTARDDCPAGAVCVAHECVFLCSSDADCPPGAHCAGETCTDGERSGPPLVEAVSGTSASPCSAAGLSLGPCLGSALVVTGRRLTGAGWLLAGSESQGTFELVAAPGATDTRVRLAPDLRGAADLAPGSYVLSAQAGAQLTQAPVQLLKGDRGEPGPAGLAAHLYRYEGAAPVAVAERAPDRMLVRLPAPQAPTSAGPYGEPAALPLDDARLLALCADDDGCSITLGATGWVDASGRTLAAALSGGACRMFVTVAGGQRHWTVDETCTVFYALRDPTRCSGGVCPELPGYYARYFSSRFGIDGVDAVTSAGDDRKLLLGFKRACGLYESPPDTSAGGLQPDTAAGLYLVASTPRWGADNYPPPAEWPPSVAGRGCVLVIED